MQVRAALKGYVEKKVSKLDRYMADIREVEVILGMAGDQKVAEMIVHPRAGERIHGQQQHEDQFAAVDLLIDKMYNQLHKTKEKKEDRRKRSERVPTPPDPSDAVGDEPKLESYQEVMDNWEQPKKS